MWEKVGEPGTGPGGGLGQVETYSPGSCPPCQVAKQWFSQLGWQNSQHKLHYKVHGFPEGREQKLPFSEDTSGCFLVSLEYSSCHFGAGGEFETAEQY